MWSQMSSWPTTATTPEISPEMVQRATSEAAPVHLLDVNVLLALMWDQHVHHRSAREQFAGVTSFATCPTTESGLLRLLLTQAVVGRRVAPIEALTALAALRSAPGWRWVPDDTTLAHAAVDVRVLAGRRQVTDLHLVNLAAQTGCVVTTFDAGLPTWLAPEDRRFVWLWRP